MKHFVKKLSIIIMAVILIVSVIPFAAYAAKYDNPAFKLSVVSETSSELVITLDLSSGKFNCADFGFTAKSGYTCTKLAKGSSMSSFVDYCDDNGKSPLFVTNYKTGLISFASSIVYDRTGAMVKATFSKSGKITYKPGDISVTFTNCAISEGDKSVSLTPSVFGGAAEYDVQLKYHDSYQIQKSSEKCTFSSSNTKVAIVNANGLVHAGIKGNATITADYGTYVEKYNITVKFTFGQSLMYYLLFGFIWMKPAKF